MRRLAILAGVVALGLIPMALEAAGSSPEAGVSGGSVPGGNPWVEWHFAGTARLEGATRGSDVRNLLAESATQRLVRDTLDKLAQTPQRWYLTNRPPSAPPLASWVRPLLDDLLAVESRGEYRAGSDGPIELAVAVRLGPERRPAWETHWSALAKAFGGGDAIKVSAGGLSVEEIRGSQGGVVWRRAQAGEWTLASVAAGASASLASLAAQTARPGGADADDWLGLRVRLDAMAAARGWSRDLPWPDVDLHCSGRRTSVRTEGRLLFPAALDLKLEPWRIPTNTICEPLISFAAARGIPAWLGRLPFWKLTGLSQAPDQLYGWSLAEVPFHTFVAWELPDYARLLPEGSPLTPQLIRHLLPNVTGGNYRYDAKAERLAWVGLPIAEPFVSRASEKDPDFVMGGVFPLPRFGSPAPAALLSQIVGRTNQVFFHWEITAERIVSWRNISGLFRMLSLYAPPPTNSPVQLWMVDTNVSRHLGNAGTEITRVSDRELRVTRTSSIGLTGFEIMALLRWLDDPQFPRYTEPPPGPLLLQRRGELPRKSAATNAAPATRATPAPLRPPSANRAVPPRPSRVTTTNAPAAPPR